MAVNQDDLDLNVAWQEACESFARTTKIDLRAVPSPTAEQVIAKFNTRKAKDEKEHAKLNAAKKIALKTLTCVVNLGGIAAQGASMVNSHPSSGRESSAFDQ